MPDIGFRTAWMFSIIVLLILAFSIGWMVRKTTIGILVDNRGRCSLTHFQLVLWTIVICSSVIAVLISSHFDPKSISLSTELLGLMGISAGSGVLGAGVKGIKDAPGSQSNIAREGKFTLSNGQSTEIQARFAQIWLEEEGDFADKVVNITKFQNFIFTLIICVIYITGAWNSAGLPELPENVIWLIGISQAGYVGGKVPNRK